MTDTSKETTQTLNLVTAAKIAKVTPGTIRYWILTGRLKGHQVGAYWTIMPEDLEAAMAYVKDDGVNGNTTTESGPGETETEV